MAPMPPMPSTTLPKDESEWRFHDTGYPSEWVEMYRSSGFHPINLGDTFKNGQYRVIRKLGYGSFSTVWLARDAVLVTIVRPLALRSPELILGGKIGSSIDIWSFGCLIFELLTGVSLFSVVVYFEDDRESTDDEHILQMNDILEPLPDVWLQKTWTRARKYFGPERERLGPIADGQNEPYVDDPLELRLKEYKPKDIDEEAGVITSLIRSILRYEPSQRSTAEELLKHSWFHE
ncbi:hypothetical protein Z517_01753 [Fonsecaea pedrosoi CBS 271.37]|uniref:Protein kinase domain-containing protein n=1 Tax=Fonsecaea pedrosoi CBS 271.37 TaxID=1442368 RepID=A0A0D2FI56_9EURO|nr:uncharacterized protein Z517_01753 [Fonsecaea pedrosoi CBS 271.37]KIW86357.1 hypothetical protein Z517_01753 [Fonsecaea pedrosoi CBS 271.37]